MRFVVIGLVACMTLAACQTVQGAGRDVENAGKALEKAVE
ncbi:MAG: entericidin A/B family lipoprotein [Roseovarius sp.]|jgi:predicted small secreted protein|nr:entericidin A/B family lipoprotein [Roseovarius sp.]